jgi:hypothetical protein
VFRMQGLGFRVGGLGAGYRVQGVGYGAWAYEEEDTKIDKNGARKV